MMLARFAGDCFSDTIHQTKASADIFRLPFVSTDTLCCLLNNEKRVGWCALFLLNFASFLMLSVAKGKEETQTSSPPALEFALCPFLRLWLFSLNFFSQYLLAGRRKKYNPCLNNAAQGTLLASVKTKEHNLRAVKKEIPEKEALFSSSSEHLKIDS